MSEERPGYPVGVATGIGSWPGTDPREAAATVIGELEALPHLVELPARGVGADMIGRSGALLVDIAIDLSTTGYRLVPHVGSVHRGAADHLRRDLDALEEAWERAGLVGSGRVIKLQSAGPLTLGAELELTGGKRVLTDRGALRDIADSLAEGMRVHAAEVERRLGARAVVQFDEPQLPAVLGGTLRGRSAFDSVAALPEPEVAHLLEHVFATVDRPVALHCCAPGIPWKMLRGLKSGRSGIAAVSFDAPLLTAADLDGVGELIEAGVTLMLGLVPTTLDGRAPAWREVADVALKLVDRLGFARGVLAERVLVTPRCGLSGADLSWARGALRLCRDVATALAEEPERL
ncbi:methionine synthase [Rhodococcus sp. D2-41]|uniref:Methionine synthase n=1 Tax=Speluncibacter jeojiensis TaxID=2710754 RepID=A0A9X4M865_9ACTN|nr:methionine synthase [Rhodococcus sp. D2-41]MDG3012786.1 methionine synthase [Rhodococcus sp. D2-41]MDG3017103.1 methionine synthase [Corynebacteriales bacterium D3-21]